MGKTTLDGSLPFYMETRFMIFSLLTGKTMYFKEKNRKDFSLKEQTLSLKITSLLTMK